MLSHMSTRHGTVTLDERGRVVLPAALRRRLGIQPGDELVVSQEADGALRLTSRHAAARALIGLAGSADHSTVEELRTDRGHDGALEDAETHSSSR